MPAARSFLWCETSGLCLLQVQSRLLTEDAFRDTVAVLQAGQARLRTHMRSRTAARLQHSMQRCVALSRARAQRARRMERLKSKLDATGSGVESADPSEMQALLHPHDSSGISMQLPGQHATPPASSALPADAKTDITSYLPAAPFAITSTTTKGRSGTVCAVHRHDVVVCTLYIYFTISRC